MQSRESKAASSHGGHSPADQSSHTSTRVARDDNGHKDGGDVSLPPAAVSLHLASLYFDYVHDQLHTLFQKPAFMSDLATDTTPRVLRYAMMALAARFSLNEYFDGVSPRTRGTKWARKAASLLDVSDVSLTSIQACVMLGACRIIEGDAPGESVYYGIACRMAQLLDLPHRHCKTRLERELNIRVWHTLCMVDEWSSSGVRVPRQIANPPLDVPLPMEEMAFLQLRKNEVNDPSASLDQAPSLLGQMIALNRIFRDVNALNSQAADAQVLPPDIRTVEVLTARIEQWEAQLPSYMRDEPANLAHYAAQGLGRIYAAVYLGVYHFGQLLYYQFLQGAKDDQHNGSIINAFAGRCKSHAAKLCNMVYAALDTPGCDVLYNMVGHILVIASTIQIHTLLFSTDPVDITSARQRLERNFNILLRLRELWPSLDFCMMRLQAFHKACRTSMETSFKLDRWMLKFLSEFANPVEDRPDERDSEWVFGDIVVTPSSDFGVNTMATMIRADRYAENAGPVTATASSAST
ncbi:hypothetical protein AC579_4280 [Pseudocercospora musae]|uniref:Xylanolytic transcriptional activator regulatory domain-containing protein n=1 Tax=Pseudocercospora musae TaxID=113226 RepID=A0A139IAS8_9PEZI|nr:hypothetical protein AC579_4280 [Pseudocercospora musae]